MKKITLFLMVIASMQLVRTQTVLKAGDIAIVQINNSYKSFDFVPLVPITEGTVIVFSDMKYSALKKGFIPFADPQYDGIHTFTASKSYAAGTVIQSNGTVVESKKFITSGTNGLSLIAFQKNNSDTTFLTAFGWYAAENFKPGENDIPPGLSVADNTVVKFDSTDTYFNKYLYANIRFDNMGDVSKMTGTAIQLRRRFADHSNYLNSNSISQNTAVPNFTVLAADINPPILQSSYPAQNQLNVSRKANFKLSFNEPVLAIKTITLRETASNTTAYILPAEVKKNTDNSVSFSFEFALDYAKSYTLEIPQGCFSDEGNNPWPFSKDTVIAFATCAKRSNISMNFVTEAKQDMKFELKSVYNDYGNYYPKGDFYFDMKGIPVLWNGSQSRFIDNDTTKAPDISSNRFGALTMFPSKVVMDLTKLNNTITSVYSWVYANNSEMGIKLYSGGNIVESTTVNGTTDSNLSLKQGEVYDFHYKKQYVENSTGVKIDSIVYWGWEAAVLKTEIELIDLAAPTVELGNARVVCEGDSVQLDAGLTPGAVYSWNNNETNQKIWAKTSGTYSVTVKNTLGQATDNVQVTVKPIISLSLPDTIIACVGDTITLTAGTDSSNSYFWSPDGQTTPSIKITKSGMYHVLVNNGFGGCFNTDSTRVIFEGAKVRLFNFQGGSYGSGDVRAELYKKNTENKFVVFRDSAMLDFVEFDKLPIGDYIMKMHFVNFSFTGENPWLDTYHDGKTEWKKVVPFHLTCQTDTMIGFLIAGKSSFEFNGTGVVSGKVQIISGHTGVANMRAKANINVDCNTRIVLYNSNAEIIATACPDANGDYSFTKLPAGDYTVGVERTGFEVQHVFTASITAGATISNVNFTVNETTQTVIQGLVSGMEKPLFSNMLNLYVYPNPTKSNATISYELTKSEKVTISIIDITGEIMNTEKIYSIEGQNKFTLNVGNLKGMYFVKMVSSHGTAITSLLVK